MPYTFELLTVIAIYCLIIDMFKDISAIADYIFKILFSKNFFVFMSFVKDKLLNAN